MKNIETYANFEQDQYGRWLPSVQDTQRSGTYITMSWENVIGLITRHRLPSNEGIIKFDVNQYGISLNIDTRR